MQRPITPAGEVVLRRAAEGDIPFIMATERMPGFRYIVGRWEEEAHRTEIGNPASAVFISELAGRPLGFAILVDLDDPAGNVHLKRIAVQKPGQGVGRALLAGILRWSFERPLTHRLWLTVAPHNKRARHVYRSLGFQEEGVLRESHLGPAGFRVSPVLMSMLRPEWEALARATEGSAMQ